MEVAGTKDVELPLRQGKSRSFTWRVRIQLGQVFPKEQPPRAENADERDAGAQRVLRMNLEEPDHPLGGRPSASEREAAGKEEIAPSDHEGNSDRVPAPGNQREAPAAGDEEVSAVLPRKPRRQRRVVSEAEDDNEGDESA